MKGDYMFSRFSEEVRKVLLGAKKEMQSLKHSYVGTEHLVLSILKKNNIISDRFKSYGISYDTFKKEVINVMGIGNKENEWFIYTPLLKKVIENSIILSKEKNSKEVTLDILFLSLIEEGEGVAIRVLLSMGVDIDLLYEEINQNRKSKKLRNKLLVDEFGVNLNKKAIDGELDPVINREDEVLRIIEILCRRTKNNPLLIGDAGVGKTAIVEELSRKIVNGEVPSKLLNKRVISISMASLVSGTKYRGEFEERVTKMLKEVEESNDVIIFIDEIHTLVGAGGAEGAIDASNILKPSLARGKINIIGATTTVEYKKFIEDDKALSRRFQTIMITEPDEEKVYHILARLKPIYEDYHNVIINDDVLKLIITLSNKYLYNRKQPDKSIDVLDEVCSKVSILEDKMTKKNIYYKNLLKTIKDLKNEAIINNKFNEAVYLREEELKLESCINKMDVKIMRNTKRKEVTKQMVAEVIKIKSNIPVYELVPSSSVITDLKDFLKKTIIGQDKAINAICDYTRKITLGIKYDKKPVSFLFVGPTGVGKTFLAKEYNKFMFGEENIIRLDMSEYKEEHSVSKIIGSPPGYVGYQDKSSVLEEIKDKPHSVILLDEVEKAHPDVLNLFLQILDEGKIKDSSGNVFRFDNNIIIMTSNAGCNKKNIGFEKDSEESLMSGIKNYFSSEFINRIEKVIIFNKFSYDDIKRIVMNSFDKIIHKIHVDYQYHSSDIDDVIKESDYEVYGARKIEKIIMNKIEDHLFQHLDSKIEVN